MVLTAPLGLLLICGSGCASAPSGLERRFFNIETNLVERVTYVTNAVPVSREITNGTQGDVTSGGLAAASVSNRVAVVEWQTNVVPVRAVVESYVFTPNTNAHSVSNTVGRVVGVFGFPFGELVSMGVLGAFGIWGQLRSRRASKVAGVLAQVIETGRVVLQSTPQGRALDDQWKLWMVKHQGEAGVLEAVSRLLVEVVDNDSARAVAKELAAKLRVES